MHSICNSYALIYRTYKGDVFMSDNLSNFNKIFDETVTNDLQQLSKKHNISYTRLMLSYISGLKHGLTHELIIVGLRFSCSRTSRITEYFTKEDIAILLDCSIEEAEQRMIDSGNALKITWM